MKRPLFWALDRPALVSTLIAIVTVVFALQIPRLEIDSSTEKLHEGGRSGTPVLRPVHSRSSAATRSRLSSSRPTTYSTAASARRHSAAVGRLRAARRRHGVESLTTLQNIKGEGDTLLTDPLVPASIPTAASELAQIRS